MAALHVKGTGDVNEEWRHVGLRAFTIQQGVAFQDAEGVLVLVDRVGVRRSGVLALGVGGGATGLLLVLHHQVCVALRHHTGSQRFLFFVGTQNTSSWCG